MSCASKKQKGKGVSADGSNVGFRHPNHVSRLEHNLDKALLSERNIDLNNLIRAGMGLLGHLLILFTEAKIVFELAKLLYCIKHHEKLNVGKLIGRAIIRVGSTDSLDAMETRQTTIEKEVANLTKAIRDSYLSASEHHNRARLSSNHAD
ncbi:hypothetical protein QYF36_022729 [Acer negundo]|nr:hypothetical protein QYF36_022729 [Acer negundo]